MTSDERRDARAALALLHGTGVTLEQAARLATGRTSPGVRIALGAAVDEFRREHAQQWRPATAEYFEYKLESFAAALGRDKWMDSITVAEVEGHCKRGSAGGTAAQWRAVRALLRWAYRHRPPYLPSDLAAEVRMPTATPRTTVDFLSVEECRKLFGSLPGYHHAALALALFSGVRPFEVAGRPPLLWRHVDCEEQIIRIPAEVAKTGVARIIEGAFPVLWEWLRAHQAGPGEPVCPHAWAHVQRRCAAALQRPWPHDALRHTFATYHVSMFKDAAKTALVLGHEGSPALLHRHYRGMVAQVEARQFAELRPAGV